MNTTSKRITNFKQKSKTVKARVFLHGSESVGFIFLYFLEVWYFLQQSPRWSPHLAYH